MKISTRGRYGLRAMVDIAIHANEKCISLKSIAERQGISENYLEQLMSSLKKGGLVKSTRGSQGGYILNEEPQNISVGDILRALEGNLSPVNCVDDETQEPSCAKGVCIGCVTKSVWEKIYESLNDVIDNITLGDLVDDYRHNERGEPSGNIF